MYTFFLAEKSGLLLLKRHNVLPPNLSNANAWSWPSVRCTQAPYSVFMTHTGQRHFETLHVTDVVKQDFYLEGHFLCMCETKVNTELF